jgi:hypothetical protein
MRGITGILTDARREVKSFATDAERSSARAHGALSGTLLADGPVPPTGKSTKTDYVCVMQFAGGKITHMTKT